jgi:hypothetical protein
MGFDMPMNRSLLLLGPPFLAILAVSESKSLGSYMKTINTSGVETVLGFLDRINQHDVDKLAEYMTEDHVFIDSLGQSVSGREKMRFDWRHYCCRWKASAAEQVARVVCAGDCGKWSCEAMESLRRQQAGL